jgi:hypothetical protein
VSNENGKRVVVYNCEYWGYGYSFNLYMICT